MTKLQLSLTSLVAVLPAGFLIFLLVNVLLSHSQNLSTIAFVILGLTLLSALATLLIPAAVWVGGRKKPALVTAKVPKEKSKGKDSESIDEEVEALDEESDLEESSSGSYSVDEALGEASDFDLEEADELTMEDDLEAGIETEPVEDFDDFDLEEEEEPKPKKKKR